MLHIYNQTKEVVEYMVYNAVRCYGTKQQKYREGCYFYAEQYKGTGPINLLYMYVSLYVLLYIVFDEVLALITRQKLNTEYIYVNVALVILQPERVIPLVFQRCYTFYVYS